MRSSHHWRVVFLLSLVSCVAYLARSDVAVAQERMVPAIGITMAGMGAITAWAFQLSYALFQVPTGMLGERFGARRALALSLVLCGASSFITSVLPREGAVIVLVMTRILLGVAQAAVFPVAAMSVMLYVPVVDRVRATAIYIATSSLGAAAAPLIMAPVMERFGWRAVFVVSGVIASVTALVWYAFMPSPDARDVSVLSSDAPVGRRSATSELKRLVRDRRLRLLSLSYVLHSAVWFVFVFWFFRYLTEGRGFTILSSGMWGSLPSFAAFVFGPFIGMAADRLGVRLGAARARRNVAITCLLSAASFVIAGAMLPGAILAILALSLSAGCISSAEGPFFMTATAIGADSPGAAAGVLNLMGNLGGVLSIWLVPLMSKAWGWNATLGFWSAVCVVAALLWLAVGTENAVDKPSTWRAVTA